MSISYLRRTRGHEALVADGAQHRRHLRLLDGALRLVAQARQLLLYLLLDLVERRLGRIQQHQPARGLAQDLAHQLRADRSAGTRHQHRLGLDVAGKQLEVRRHGLAAQQVLRIDRAQVAHGDAPRCQVLHPRQRAHAHLQLLELAQGCLPLAGARARKRQQHLLDLVARDHSGHALRAVDLQAGNVLAPDRRVGVDEPHDDIVAGSAQGIHQLHAGLAGAVDQHAARAARAPGRQLHLGLGQKPAREPPAAPDAQRRQDRIEEHHRARHARHAGEQHDQRPQQARKRHRRRHHHLDAPADVARDQAVEAELEERGDADQRSGQADEEQLERGRSERLAEAQREREPHGRIQDNEIDDDQDEALGVPAEAQQRGCYGAQPANRPLPKNETHSPSERLAFRCLCCRFSNLGVSQQQRLPATLGCEKPVALRISRYRRSPGLASAIPREPPPQCRAQPIRGRHAVIRLCAGATNFS